MEDNQITEATEKLVHCIGEESKRLGWRIATELSSIETSSLLHELTQEMSKINLTLNKVNDTLKKIAEKD